MGKTNRRTQNQRLDRNFWIERNDLIEINKQTKRLLRQGVKRPPSH